MKRFISVLMVLVMMFSLAACMESDSIIGKWAFGVNTVEFREDNTVSISVNETLNYDGTYTVEGDKITVTAEGMLGEVSEEFTYSLNKGKLSLTGDITLMGAADMTIEFSKSGNSSGITASPESSAKGNWFSNLFSFLSPKNSGAATQAPAEDESVNNGKESKGFFASLFSFFSPKKDKNQVTETLHIHEYSEATCTEPAKCICGDIGAVALGHNYVEGVCLLCGEKDPNFNNSVRVGYVMYDCVRVRTAPGTHSDVVMHYGNEIQLNTSHPVKIYGSKILSNDAQYPYWYFVGFTYNGISYEGFMYSDYIKVIS